MLLLETVAAAVGNIKVSLVVFNAFGFPTHLTHSYNLLSSHVNFSHATLCKRLSAYVMSIRCNVQITAIGSHFAVVGHVFCGSARGAIRANKLYNVRLVYADSQQRVVNLNDIVWCVTQFFAVNLLKPFVG